MALSEVKNPNYKWMVCEVHLLGETSALPDLDPVCHPLVSWIRRGPAFGGGELREQYQCLPRGDVRPFVLVSGPGWSRFTLSEERRFRVGPRPYDVRGDDEVSMLPPACLVSFFNKIVLHPCLNSSMDTGL